MGCLLRGNTNWEGREAILHYVHECTHSPMHTQCDCCPKLCNVIPLQWKVPVTALDLPIEWLPGADSVPSHLRLLCKSRIGSLYQKQVPHTPIYFEPVTASLSSLGLWTANVGAHGSTDGFSLFLFARQGLLRIWHKGVPALKTFCPHF